MRLMKLHNSCRAILGSLNAYSQFITFPSNYRITARKTYGTILNKVYVLDSSFFFHSTVFGQGCAPSSTSVTSLFKTGFRQSSGTMEANYKAIKK